MNGANSGEHAPVVTARRNGAVATVLMNQPDSLNSFTPELRKQLSAALAQASAHSAVRTIVLGGSGRFFSAGANLKSAAAAKESIRDTLLKEYKPVFDAVTRAPQPVIAAIQGGAAGIGMSLAIACDLVVMEENAFLLCPFSAIGLVPDGGSTAMLTRAMGQRAAFEFAISGERMTASRAEQLNLVNRVVGPGEALRTAENWAAELARKAPLALAATKKLMRQSPTLSFDDMFMAEVEAQESCSATADAAEGIAAFLEKRAPRFTGA
ncbi:enoyl-CoA hydratase/isomerase family protein [Candidatus Foliamicus sp.]